MLLLRLPLLPKSNRATSLFKSKLRALSASAWGSTILSGIYVMSGTLYIVATPIGNLEDITLRALRVLKEVDLIAAEDTRVTRKLLARYDIHTSTTPYHEHNAIVKSSVLIKRLKCGENIALVSEAGTPGISDPGHELIRMAIDENTPIVFVPGANAVIMSLVVSGLSTTHFAFDGFPPRKSGERKTFFRSLAEDHRTLVFYESPSRLLPALETILAEMGDRRTAVLREATKFFEEIFRGRITEAISWFRDNEPRGEITLVVEGKLDEANDMGEDKTEEVKSRLRKLVDDGMTVRDAVRQAAIEFHLPRKTVYDVAIKFIADQ